MMNDKKYLVLLAVLSFISLWFLVVSVVGIAMILYVGL